MTKKGIAKSKKENSFEAGLEATQKALENAQISDCDIAFVYANPGYEDYKELLAGVKKSIGNASLVGCMSGGLITKEGRDEDDRAVAVMVIKSDKIKFTPVLAEGLKEDSAAVGRKIGESLSDNWPNDAKILLTLPGGLTVNPDSFFKGLEDSLPQKIPFVGGASAGLLDFKSTYQFFNDLVLTDAAVCVLMSGDFDFEIGFSHGAVSTKISQTVTKANKNIIQEFNNLPAFEIYKDFLGTEINHLNILTQTSVCLGVKAPEGSCSEGFCEELILRIPLAILEDGSLVMAGEWPQGTEVFISQRNHERIIERSEEVAKKIKNKLDELGKKPEFVFHFNCMGRSKNITSKETAEEEVRISQEILESKDSWFGWYTFGEIAPIAGKNEFHNWTGVLLVIF